MDKQDIAIIGYLIALIIFMAIFLSNNSYKAVQMVILALIAYLLGKAHQLKIGETKRREEPGEIREQSLPPPN